MTVDLIVFQGMLNRSSAQDCPTSWELYQGRAAAANESLVVLFLLLLPLGLVFPVSGLELHSLLPPLQAPAHRLL